MALLAGDDGISIGWDDIPLASGVEPGAGRRRVLEALWRDALGDPSVLLALERPLRSFCEGLRGRPLAFVQSLTDAASDALERADWEPPLVETLRHEFPALPESTGWSCWDRIEARFTGQLDLQAQSVRVSPAAEEDLCALHGCFAPVGLGAAFAHGVREAITGYAGAEFVPGYRTGIRRCRVAGLPVFLYSRGGSRMGHLIAVRASVAFPMIGSRLTPRSAPALLDFPVCAPR